MELEMCKRILGEKNLSTLVSMNNLAFMIKGLGQIKDAVNLMEEYIQL